jgi:hypothetical protein
VGVPFERGFAGAVTGNSWSIVESGGVGEHGELTS